MASLAAELKDLFDLLQCGALTQEEFAEAKLRVIGKQKAEAAAAAPPVPPTPAPVPATPAAPSSTEGPPPPVPSAREGAPPQTPPPPPAKDVPIKEEYPRKRSAPEADAPVALKRVKTEGPLAGRMDPVKAAPRPTPDPLPSGPQTGVIVRWLQHKNYGYLRSAACRDKEFFVQRKDIIGSVTGLHVGQRVRFTHKGVDAVEHVEVLDEVGLSLPTGSELRGYVVGWNEKHQHGHIVVPEFPDDRIYFTAENLVDRQEVRHVEIGRAIVFRIHPQGQGRAKMRPTGARILSDRDKQPSTPLPRPPPGYCVGVVQRWDMDRRSGLVESLSGHHRNDMFFDEEATGKGVRPEAGEQVVYRYTREGSGGGRCIDVWQSVLPPSGVTQRGRLVDWHFKETKKREMGFVVIPEYPGRLIPVHYDDFAGGKVPSLGQDIWFNLIIAERGPVVREVQLSPPGGAPPPPDAAPPSAPSCVVKREPKGPRPVPFKFSSGADSSEDEDLVRPTKFEKELVKRRATEKKKRDEDAKKEAFERNFANAITVARRQRMFERFDKYFSAVPAQTHWIKHNLLPEIVAYMHPKDDAEKSAIKKALGAHLAREFDTWQRTTFEQALSTAKRRYDRPEVYFAKEQTRWYKEQLVKEVMTSMGDKKGVTLKTVKMAVGKYLCTAYAAWACRKTSDKKTFNKAVKKHMNAPPAAWRDALGKQKASQKQKRKIAKRAAVAKRVLKREPSEESLPLATPPSAPSSPPAGTPVPLADVPMAPVDMPVAPAHPPPAGYVPNFPPSSPPPPPPPPPPPRFAPPPPLHRPPRRGFFPRAWTAPGSPPSCPHQVSRRLLHERSPSYNSSSPSLTAGCVIAQVKWHL